MVVTRELPPVGGGAGRVALDLAEELGRRGHGVDVVTMAFGDLPAREECGSVTIRRVGCGRRRRDRSTLIEMLRFRLAAGALVRDLRARRSFQLVHAHAILPDAWIAARAADSLPLVVTAHGSDVPGFNPTRFRLAHRLAAPLWRRTLARAGAVVAPSRYLAELLRRARPEQDVTIVPNGIRTDLFDDPGEHGRREGFLMCTRLERRKNIPLFFDALACVEAPQRLDVIGEGPDLAVLRRRTAAQSRHEIVFHGALAYGSAAWRDLFQRRRFFVLPSARENLPVSLLEAQLAGLVVLAGPAEGCREALGDAGLYFPELAPQALAATLRAVLREDPVALDALAERGRRRVREGFSVAAMADRYLEVYAAALARHAP